MKTKYLIMSILTTLLLTSFVSAVLVGSVYSKAHPFEIHKGETKNAELILQNKVGNEDVTFKIDIKQGLNIASLEQDIILVKKGTEARVPIKITIPREYDKTLEEVKININTITPGDSSGVALGIGFTENFDVKILEPEKEPFPMWIIIIIIAIIIVVAIIIYLVKKKKPVNKIK